MAGAYRNVARRSLMVAAWAFAMVLASLFLATPALAKDYSIDAVNIAAAVNSDGTLSVTEMRDFNFDGSFHGVYWKIPKGYNSSNGKEVDITINYVGVYENGQLQPFGLSNAETDGTYEVTPQKNSFSHLADAAQYLALGANLEGGALAVKAREVELVNPVWA